MHRMSFEKTGSAVWISHLDTMRLMQRAFRRAGVLLHHSQGYTPHAYVSMLLPLSVGTESRCEIMEYALDEDLCLTPEQMNSVLPEGIRVLSVYESARKAAELRTLRAELTLEYDFRDPAQAAETVGTVLAMPELIVEKRTKRGMEESDIRPLLYRCALTPKKRTLQIVCDVSAQNPALNPMLLAAAIGRYAPDWAPDFVKCTRLEVFDSSGDVFR